MVFEETLNVKKTRYNNMKRAKLTPILLVFTISFFLLDLSIINVQGEGEWTKNFEETINPDSHYNFNCTLEPSLSEMITGEITITQGSNNDKITAYICGDDGYQRYLDGSPYFYPPSEEEITSSGSISYMMVKTAETSNLTVVIDTAGNEDPITVKGEFKIGVGLGIYGMWTLLIIIGSIGFYAGIISIFLLTRRNKIKAKRESAICSNCSFESREYVPYCGYCGNEIKKDES